MTSNLANVHGPEASDPGPAAGDLHLHAEHPCRCYIVPIKVIERLAKDTSLSAAARQSFQDALRFEKEWRKTRAQAATMMRVARQSLMSGQTALAAAAPPAVLLFDCQHGTSLPGVPIAKPGSSGDVTVKRCSVETAAVAAFFQKEFNRNSLDNAGLTLQSSVHYSVNYNNAGWTGSQMIYGDGDGNIFLDFTKSNDVIGHELAHGLTQYTAGFVYKNQPGGLNESMSDVFGTMFRQWRAGHNVNKADWLIGKEIMGPAAKARGYTCLRDMANPAAAHCLAPQPTKFSQYHDGMDPHESSGIPNLAFYKAAKAIGGMSWKKAGQVWYHALNDFPPSPNMKMATFADRTRTLAASLFSGDPGVKTAVHKAWKAVGL